jgi:hypothetical protein
VPRPSQHMPKANGGMKLFLSYQRLEGATVPSTCGCILGFYVNLTHSLDSVGAQECES